MEVQAAAPAKTVEKKVEVQAAAPAKTVEVSGLKCVSCRAELALLAV